MKNGLMIIITIAFVFFLYITIQKKGNPDYQRQFDSLKTEISKLQAELDTVKANTDTLKLGQKVIFDEVKKSSEKSFWDLF